jgi:4-amino-4-deoxy-L-arabinose transferase-like glycosyltransferase
MIYGMSMLKNPIMKIKENNMVTKLKKVYFSLKNNTLFKQILSWIILFLVIWISFDLLTYISNFSSNNLQIFRSVMALLLCVIFVIIAYKKGKNTLTTDHLITLIILAGFVLRIGYAFYTGPSSRQHDVEMYTYINNEWVLNINGIGHFTGKLPDTITWQFYHPPLWHALIALWMHIYSFFENTKDVATLYSSGMIVSSFVSCLTLYGFKKIIYSLSSNDKVKIIFMILFAFHSQFFIMAGWMNNEGLAFFFMIYSLYYGIKFYQERKWKNIILCAIMLGLGAMSKVSVAVICVPLALMFITAWYHDIKNKIGVKTFVKYVAFICIVAPLSLWFLTRNYLKFGITSISVPGVDPYTSSMGVVSYSIWQRFGLFNPANLFQSTYCILRPNANGYMDYNVWLYTLKCSVLGEYSYWQDDLFSTLLIFFNLMIIIFSLFTMVYVVIKERKTSYLKLNILLLSIYFVSLIAYIIFQILYPVTCTQDFRYMTLILLPGIYFIAKYYSSLKDNKASKVMRIITLVLVIGFSISSILTFISLR